MAAEQTPRPASLDELLKERQEMEALHQRPPLSFWQLAGRRLVRDRLTMAAMFVLFTILVLSVGGEWISSTLLGVDPYDTDLLRSLEPPSWDHLLGTNVNGQDQFARILVAGRISLAIGFFGAFFTLVIAITLGMITAYFGGFVDDLIMWVINTLESIPALFLLLLVGSLFDLSPAWLTIIFALLGWPTITRLVRSSVFS
ncbi:MAG: ABC transporter permease subunit, partial [Chloroflexota bacterium]